MKKIYVALEDLWPYVQKEYEKAMARGDLSGANWCNHFLQLITMADHKKVEVEE